MLRRSSKSVCQGFEIRSLRKIVDAFGSTGGASAPSTVNGACTGRTGRELGSGHGGGMAFCARVTAAPETQTSTRSIQRLNRPSTYLIKSSIDTLSPFRRARYRQYI